MDYKDEFNYYAVVMIFGKRSPKISDFQIFKFDTLKRHPEITFLEMSALTLENIQDINRKILIDPYRSFVANNCRMSSGVCRTINFVDSQHDINVKDNLFTEKEYEYFSNNWDKTIKNKIQTIGLLFRSVCEKTLIRVPILINEFPNITSILFKHPEVL